MEPSLGPVCDTATGQCLNCLNNTEGFECELCLSGYFGDPALDIACQGERKHKLGVAEHLLANQCSPLPQSVRVLLLAVWGTVTA